MITPPRWVMLWLLVSIAITGWDASFVLMRPHSLPGGDLAFLWPPYETYVVVDHGYGDLTNGWISGQAVMTLVEVLLGLTALLLWRAGHAMAGPLALVSIAMTGAKTSLIFLAEWMSGLENVGHNTTADLISLYVLPNVVWVIVPIVACVALMRSLSAAPNPSLSCAT